MRYLRLNDDRNDYLPQQLNNLKTSKWCYKIHASKDSIWTNLFRNRLI